MPLINDSLPSGRGGPWGATRGDLGGGPLRSSPEGRMRPTGFPALMEEGPPHAGSLARRESGGRCRPRPPRSRQRASPVAVPGPGILCSEEGEVRVPAQDQRQNRSHCQVRRGVLHSLQLVSKHLRDLSDLITPRRTYLVNVISDLY